MSSRQEQKERRRKEREERERAEANAQKRKQLAQIVGGVVVVAAVIVGVILGVSGGGGDSGSNSADAEETPDAPLVAIPAQRATDLKKAVSAAGCAFREFDNEGQDHVGDERTAKDYKTNPPTSGNHNPVPASDGYYAPGKSPALKNSVHALEHGRVQIQYKAGLTTRQLGQLRSLYNEDVAQAGQHYHMQMFQNTSGMKYDVAMVSWTRYVVCNTMNDKVFDAMRIFRDQFVDQAPEQVP